METPANTEEHEHYLEIINPFVEAEATEKFGVIRKLGELALRADTVLQEHQIEAFEDIVSFYAEGGRECYAKLPTGTGKTVLFVELCKRLVEESDTEGHAPKIIVLEPTKDLVNQTVGSIDPVTQKRRGFKGFAPELDARPIHSDVSDKLRFKNLMEAQIVVTTYDTFRNITKQLDEALAKTPEEWRAAQRENEIEIKRLLAGATELKLQRAQVLHEKYIKQEVNRMRGDVLQLKDAIDSGDLAADEFDLKLLEDLGDLASDVDYSEEDRFGRIKRYIGRIDKVRRERLLEGIGSIRTSIERRKETVAALRATDKLEGEDRQAAVRKIRLTSQQRESSVEEGLAIADLSEVERMVVWFMWRNRPDRPQLKTGDLHSYSESQLIAAFGTEIAFSSGRAGALQKMNKHYEWLLAVRETAADFELIVCDEAHRVIGKETWQAVSNYARDKDIAILGLTATDELTDRTLEDYFEKKAHELTKQEAIKREIVNPIALYVYNTGLRFNDVDLDVAGDYDGLSFRAMRFSHERNAIGVELIKKLIEHGYQGMSPCIAGDEGQHAKMIANLLRQQKIIDPRTGEERNIVAHHILDDTPKDLRKQYYERYERGEIDWLTSIDVLGEGWDSDAAKAMVSFRPTRSPLIATQRLGRIGRTHEGAPISIAIDLFDGIVSREGRSEIPPVLAVDVFEVDGGEQGLVIGNDGTVEPRLHKALRDSMPTDKVVPHYTEYIDTLNKMPVVNTAGLVVRSGTNESVGENPREWQTWSALSNRYQGFLPDTALEHAPTIRRAVGRKSHYLVELFNVADVTEYFDTKPVINPWKVFKDGEKRWITAEGCKIMLSKAMPNISESQIETAIISYEEEHGTTFNRQLARKQLSFMNTQNPQYGILYMYDMEQITSLLVPYLRSD